MNRAPLAILALALLAFTSCSATLTVRGTAPRQDNGGTCVAPVLSPAPPGAAVTVHLIATGPAGFEDSLTVAAGAPFTFSRAVAAGTYTARVWASDAGGAGCDTTITLAVKNPPWRVQL